jgi:hypothetical protein
VGIIAYMAVVREAEAVQMWNANVEAFILYARIHSHLRAQLFIHCARILGFSKLVWHRATKHKLLVEAGRSYLERYIDIEAATNPLILCMDNIGVSIAKPQVVLNKSLNDMSLVPERLIEVRRCLKVCCLADDVCIFVECRLVCDGFPVI